MTLASTDCLNMEPLLEQEDKSNQIKSNHTFEQRLVEMRKIIGETNKAIKEIDEHTKYINENESLIKELELSTFSSNNILLDNSHHRDFIESVKMVVDFINNFEQHVAASESMSYTRLKSQIHNLKYYVKHNEQQLQQLDDSIASLYDQQDAINQISSSDRSQSL